MIEDETVVAVACTCEELDVLIDMVMDRDAGDALALAHMLHEITKLYVADQLPTINSITHYTIPAEREQLEVIFAGRNIRTAQNLFRGLDLDVDDDGIPL